jgi:hypothetical protein
MISWWEVVEAARSQKSLCMYNNKAVSVLPIQDRGLSEALGTKFPQVDEKDPAPYENMQINL